MNSESGAREGIERLATGECWRMLEAAAFGRLAVINVDGAPDIFPVNYVAHEGALFVRTARDTKLAHIAHHPAVAFEIDGETDDARWSVVVRGEAHRVTREDDIRESGVKALASWSPTPKHWVIKIAAHAVTGRRFAKTEGRADAPLPFSGDATVRSAEASGPSRGERPVPIPHHSPVTTRPPVSGGSDSPR